VTLSSERRKTTAEKPNAIDVFVEKHAEICRSLKKLIDLAEDHWNIVPDDVTWCNVGDLAHVQELLDEIIVFLEADDADA